MGSLLFVIGQLYFRDALFFLNLCRANVLTPREGHYSAWMLQDRSWPKEDLMSQVLLVDTNTEKLVETGMFGGSSGGWEILRLSTVWLIKLSPSNLSSSTQRWYFFALLKTFVVVFMQSQVYPVSEWIGRHASILWILSFGSASKWHWLVWMFRFAIYSVAGNSLYTD